MAKGDKHWSNTWTEVEDLGNGKFGASISVGHRVFFDKADGNKPKKHKLTDERPSKGYVLVQGAKCCVEVYPYYAKYFDVQHEEVRVEEERWIVQRLFKAPDKWRDVGAYNPQMAVEEYPEPGGDVVKVTVTYDTDYGTLTVEYFQRDGNALKHNVSFKNSSGEAETFRVLQRWAGIAGNKVSTSSQEYIITAKKVLPGLLFTFGSEEFPLGIRENLASMYQGGDSERDLMQAGREVLGACNQCADCCNHLHHCRYFNPDLPDNCEIHIDKTVQQWRPETETFNEWLKRKDRRCVCCFHIQSITPQEYGLLPNCSFSFAPKTLTEETKIPNSLLRPVVIDAYARGMKADFIYGDWVLGQDESLEIDPDTETLTPPGIDLNLAYDYAKEDYDRHTYLKFDISSVPAATIDSAKLYLYCLAQYGDNDITFYRVNSQTWLATDSVATIWALPTTNEDLATGKWVETDAWDFIDITTQFNVDYDAENTYTSQRLEDPDSTPETPNAKRDVIFLTIGSGSFTNWESQSHTGGHDPYLYVEYTPPTPVADGDLIGIPIIRRS